MKPSPKSEKMEEVINAMFGIDRSGSIQNNECVAPPIGCGRPISNFGLWSEIEQGEYRISGLCQDCQRSIFKANYE